MKNFLLGIVSVLILLAVGGGAYYFGTRNLTNKTNETGSTKIESESVGTGGKTQKPSPTPSLNVREQIVAAIKTKNTQPIESYMADIVSVRLEASGCCGLITRAEAMSQLSYLDPATGWDFDPTNPILVSLAAQFPDFYGSGWIVGVASNEYLVSFKLNSQGKIEAYNLAASYKLLLP